MKVVTIHQPEHLPWLGFFAKMAAADEWVSLDRVPFRKNYFQNRNRILGPDGAAAWLTVPARTEGHLDRPIAEVELGADPRWRRRYTRTLRQRYAKHEHGAGLLDDVASVIDSGHARIGDLNHALIDVLRAALGVATPIVLASRLPAAGTRSHLLAALCRAVGADVYLSGPSGKDYLDPLPFQREGIEIRICEYAHPTYPQRGTTGFVSHLSAVDAICNLGPDASALLEVGRSIVPFQPTAR